MIRKNDCEAKDIYGNYMAASGRCGTFVELSAAAKIYGFIGVVFRKIDNTIYNCFEFATTDDGKDV